MDPDSAMSREPSSSKTASRSATLALSRRDEYRTSRHRFARTTIQNATRAHISIACNLTVVRPRVSRFSYKDAIRVGEKKIAVARMSSRRAVLAGVTALAFLAGPLLGGRWSASRPSSKRPDWYASLVMPRWTPPSRAFGVVWTALYATMGLAAWRVARRVGGRSLPIALFAFQLALNLAWSRVFFVRHDLPGAARLAAALWLAVGAMTVAYSRVDAVAAWLSLPYVAWAGFAAVLSAGVRDLNAHRDARMS